MKNFLKNVKSQKSLFTSMFLPLIGLSLTFAAAFSIFAIKHEKIERKDEFRSRAKLIVGVVQLISQISGASEELQRTVAALGGEDHIETLMIVDEQSSKIIAGTKLGLINHYVNEIPDNSIGERLKAVSQYSDEIFWHDPSGQFLDFIMPIELFDSTDIKNPYKNMRIFLRFDLSESNKSLDIFQKRIILGGGTFILIWGFIVGWLIRQFIIGPLKDLSGSIAAGLEKSNASAINNYKTKEFKVVNDIFDEMISKTREKTRSLDESLQILRKSIDVSNSRNELITSIIENIPVALFIKDAKDKFRITVWNKAAEAIFGIPREDILGKATHELFPKDLADQYLAADTKVCLDGIKVDIPEEPSISKIRGDIILKTQKIPLIIGNSGEIAYLLGICEDITDHKKTLKELDLEKVKSIRNAKLASLGEMAAGIAHEINNPLAIIDGNIKVLRKSPLNDDDREKKLAAIEKAIGRITKIVLGLKKFSRSSEKSEKNLLSLQTIIQDSLNLLDFKCKQLLIPIEFQYRTEGRVYCDEVELEQVMVNLLNNSFDAVKNLDEKWVKVELFEEKDAIVVRVIDSGLGLEAEIRKRIFQPFYTTKPVGQGTGLGLSIVRGILEDNNGVIDLLPDEKNTCFEIRFPKKDSLTAAA